MLYAFLILSITSQVDTTYKLTDFRLPESGVMELWLGLNGGFGGGASSDGDDYFQKESYAYKGGSGDVNFYLERQNERHDFTFNITGNIDGSSSSNAESDYLVFPIEYEVDMGGYTIIDTVAYRCELAHLSESIDKDFSEDLFVTEDWMYYPFKRFFFFGIGSSISFDHNTSNRNYWSDVYTDSLPNYTDTSWSRSVGMVLIYTRCSDLAG
ncbi:hypothetical protein GF359_08915 [candidate division WOR-3 bacterium]|uniref:Uncharacterized protein n=1 Tax=candidate division WOR-3 bacterium TaxID=2052148 RepID=A0A9D5KC32_UNCW3|nr:hypothetical protein [candidate division WOR-3 bacterium]MBD3365320.1 hypothetical protein [candidate division WOR-3 bacterium]